MIGAQLGESPKKCSLKNMNSLQKEIEVQNIDENSFIYDNKHYTNIKCFSTTRVE